jgi:hypothetical protein
VGASVGVYEVKSVGVAEGLYEGVVEGVEEEGIEEGAYEGVAEGSAEGPAVVGCEESVGAMDGWYTAVGAKVGMKSVGFIVGEIVGFVVGT